MDRVLTRRRFIATLLGIMLLAHSPPLVAQFGDLPSGYFRRQALEGVRAEIGKTFFVDSSVAAQYVPAGLSLVTLGSVARWDTATARYLVSHPEFTTAVWSVLGFVHMDSLRIDDGPAIRVALAFWWLRVRPTLPANQPVPGDVWVEVGYWSPDTAFIRLQGEWPPLQTAPVHVEPADDGEWSLRLTLKDAVIHGRCRLAGARTPSEYPLPAFATVWAAGPEPTFYEIYTFYGHHTQPCVGEWTAEGNNPLAVALNRSPADVPWWAESSLADGWHARSARYRR